MGLAIFMDEKKTCYPPQDLLAKFLGLSLTQTNHRIMELAKFEWNGKPVISIEKQRKEDGKWDNNFYFIFGSAGIAIFDDNDHLKDT